MAHCCFNCNKEIELSTSGSPGRKEECPACRSDLHCCKNCVFYDSGAYNECREPQAERVVDKERGNFCDYFTFKTGVSGESGTKKSSALKELDALFK
jgi:hypothetical protein